MKGQVLKIKLAKFLDEYLGRISIRLCRALGRRSFKETSRKILFIKFWGIGSIVLSEPALRWLRRNYENCELHYLTLSDNAELFKMMPDVTKVYLLPFRNPFRFVYENLRLLRRLRRERYQLVFDAEFFANYSAIVAWLTKAPEIVGFSRNSNAKRLLLDIGISFQDKLHTSQQFLNLVQQGLGQQPQPIRPSLKPPGHLLLRNWPFLREGYIVMNINASSLALERRWPRERFVKLADFLLSTFDCHLILIGSENEAAYVRPVAQALNQYERLHDLTGQVTLSGLALLIRGAICLISNDSGPIHLASAFATPTVGFYGPETPDRYGPLSPRNLVFYRQLWCSPCMSVENAKTVNCINDLACMQDIQVKEVLPQVESFIREVYHPRMPRKQDLIDV